MADTPATKVKTLDKVRVGIIGVGGMGTAHATSLFEGKVPGAELVAICDHKPGQFDHVKKSLHDKLPEHLYMSSEEMFANDCCDALLVATPHYDHVPLSMQALEKGWHVLCEKPIGVCTKEAKKLVALAEAKPELVFSLMFNQRTMGTHQKMRKMIQDGELGEIRRVVYIITDWYRPQSYFDMGGWRATWAGEGGGVLLNQCPHQLDLWQWICGMPTRVKADLAYGKYHNIEVEDDVTATVEYANGATGVFLASTGECPGTNRLEISGDRGRLVLEGGKLTFDRTVVTEQEFNETFKGGFGAPDVWKCDIPTGQKGEQHVGVMKDWIKTIQTGEKDKMLAPGIEGTQGLSLSNAMMLSDWTGNSWIDLPLTDENETLFQEKLQERIKTSTFVKTVYEQTGNTEGTY